MAKEIRLKEDEFYSKKDLLALISILDSDKFTIEYKKGELFITEYHDPRARAPDPLPAPVVPVLQTPVPPLPAATTGPPKPNITLPWPLEKGKNEKCRRCKTERNCQECAKCWRWSAYTD